MSDGSGQSAWSYDPMGRTVSEEKTIAGITKTMGSTFNYDGSPASLTYPSGRTITYGVDSLGRPQSAVDSANSINYAQSATYAAHGALASVLNGKTSSFGGITYSLGYNNRLLPQSISGTSSNGTALSLSYSYFYNGSTNVITNNRDNGRTVTYGYDSLNRWNSASSQATSGADCWGQSVPSTGYDRYGNLLTINVSKCSAPALSISVNGNNQITNSGFTYDASGDETGDGLYSYTWDAESRLTSAAGVTYSYDGDGQRVKKSSGTLYWRGASGSVVAETDTSGNTLNEYIFFGARIARRDSSGNVYYYFGNHLGSAAITNATGALCYDADFYPIGGELDFTNTCSQSYKFAGMERDSETGEYHTQYRQYASNLGRWLTPDPSGMAAVSLANPQTWNMYAYVTNNPITLTDALGLDGNECFYYYCGPPDQESGASYDINYDPNSWMLQNNFQCEDPNEYGCSSNSFMGQDVFDTMAGQATPEQRYLSIITTGWDPVLQQWTDETTYQIKDASGNIISSQKALAAILFGEEACKGMNPGDVAECIRQTYNTMKLAGFVGGHEDYDWSTIKITIGDQVIPTNPANFSGCVFGRCGTFNSLDFSHGGNTFHVDMGNVYFFPVGTVIHLIADYLGGHTWWSGGVPPFPL
jgi:RHS repeat-associated protein